MASADNIITLTRDLLREESGSDVPVVANSFLYEAIMDGQNKWDDSFQVGGENPVSEALETGFDLVADTTLNGAITSASTSVTVDDDLNYDASGAFIVWDDNMADYISYTSYTTKVFSGVTGIGFNHEDEDALQKLYKLPTNFGSFRESALYGDGVQLNGVPLRYIGGIPTVGFFSEYNDGTNRFLVLPRGSTGSASVLFNKASATIDSTDDTVSVPDKYKMFLVWHCVSFCYMGREEDANKLLFAQSESEKVLSRALRNRNVGKKIRTRPFGRPYRDSLSIGSSVYPF